MHLKMILENSCNHHIYLKINMFKEDSITHVKISCLRFKEIIVTHMSFNIFNLYFLKVLST